MIPEPLIVSLPIADRGRSFGFYREAFGLEAVGEPADDGYPEPLTFVLNPSTHLMLVPTGGFGWVIGDRDVASSGASECVLGFAVASEGDVRDVFERAVVLGATPVSEPTSQPWGFATTFADPDGHVWMVSVSPSAS